MPLRSLSVAALAAALLLTACKSDQAPALQLSATSLAFDALLGQGSPAARTVGVTNAGGGTLARPTATIVYADGSGWLAATVTGTVAPYTLTVTPETAGLAGGTYHATVRLGSEGASHTPQDLAVTLTLEPPPTIALSATALTFTCRQGGPPPTAQQVTVTNAGGSTLATSSLAGDSWLAVTPGRGVAPYTVAVAVDQAGLLPGTYGATITVAADGATNTPQIIGVTLVVEPQALLWTSPGVAEFFALAGGPAPAPWVVSLFNVGAGTLARPTVSTQDIVCAGGWFTATVTGQADPYTLVVTADPTGIPVGGCVSVVRLDSGEGTGGMQPLLVSLDVADPAAAGRTVQVSVSGMRWAEAGFQGRSVEAPLAVTVLQADAIGAVTEVSATPITSSSELWIATIPPGAYGILVTPVAGPPRYYEVASGADQVELGAETAGVDASRVSSLTTPVTFDVDGLLAWSEGTDRLQIFDQDAQAWWSSQLGGTVAVAGGATAGTFTFDWTPNNFALAWGTDRIWATQLRADPGLAGPAYRVVAAQPLSGVVMADGVPLTVEATGLTPTTASATVPVNLRALEFAAAMPEPGASPRLDVSVRAQGVPLHVASATTDLLDLTADAGADHDYGPLSYPRFLPWQYRETLVTSRTVRVTRAHPGGKTGTFQAASERWDPVGAVPAALGPAVSAVTGVRAGGLDASAAPVTGVGTAPVIAWDAPAVGLVHGYVLDVLEFFDDPAQAAAQARRVGLAAVTTRRFTPPPGWLQDGKTYLIRIEAISDPALSGGQTPNLASPRRGRTDAWTQPISP